LDAACLSSLLFFGGILGARDRRRFGRLGRFGHLSCLGRLGSIRRCGAQAS